MQIILLTLYVLAWPVVVAAVLFVISRAFFSDWRASRRAGRSII
ncbi:putative transporter small subunit [Georgenia sp. MJ206]